MMLFQRAPQLFRPRPFNELVQAQAIEKLAKDLADSGAVDEGTPDVADSLVDNLSGKWIADLTVEYEAHKAMAASSGPIGRHASQVAALGLKHAHAESRWRDTGLAMSAAKDRLAGPEYRTGRPMSHWVHLMVLVIVAAADATAFGQVIRIVFDQDRAGSQVLVLALTATVIYLSHVAGERLRVRQEGPRKRWAGLLYPVSCLLAVALLGLIAFYVRLEEWRPIASGGFSEPGVPSAEGKLPALTTDLILRALPGATLFLALFVATTLVALSGSYLTYNPARSVYARARWQLWLTARILALRLRQLKRAEARLEAETQARLSSQRIYEETVGSRLRFAAVLKQRARLVISTRLKDPAVTSAFTAPPRGLTP